MADIQQDTPQAAKPVPKKKSKTPRLMDVFHDETPSQITDHVFEPMGEWYTRCKHCRLSVAAHLNNTLTGREHIHYYSDDNENT